jgi:hypothetical protein
MVLTRIIVPIFRVYLHQLKYCPSTYVSGLEPACIAFASMIEHLLHRVRLNRFRSDPTPMVPVTIVS